MNLTAGALEAILNGGNPVSPIFQIINTKKVPSNGTADRYRLILSDGQRHTSYAMLASQLNHLMEEIDPLCVVQTDKFMCNRMQGDKRVIILLDVKILKKGSDVGHKLGNPQPLKADGPASAEPSVHNSPAVIQDQAPLLDINSEEEEDISSTMPLATCDMNRPAQRPPLNPSSTFTSGSNTPVPALQTSKSFGGKGAPTGPGTPGSNRVHPITSLTPYQNRWRIRARVTQKSSIRTWSNSRGEGRLFNINFLDESGEIRATGFNEAVDKFYDMLEVNKVYYVSKGTLKTANKQYSNLKNDYEMSLNNDTIIEPCSENVDLPTMNFEFVPINQMEKHPPNSVIDVVGVVKVCNDVSTVVGRQTQKEITKRDLQIVDQSGVAINITLWGDEAVKFNGNGHPVIAVKGAKLSDFGGRSLSVLASSQLILNPDVREAHFLRGWYDREGAAMDFSMFRGEGTSGSGSGTNWKIFEQAKRENLGQGDKPDYFTSKATVIFMKKDNCMYRACPTENCNKKMIDQGNGMYRCEKCQREFPNYKWRMILSANLADFSDNQWITSFQESAEAMLGIKADDLGNLRESNETAFDEVFQRAVFKQYVFRLRAKVETYNEESRLKTVCMTATPINYVEYGNHLVEQLKSFIH